MLLYTMKYTYSLACMQSHQPLVCWELRVQESEADKFDRAKLVEVLTAPYIEDSGGGIVALDPHALKKLFTTTIGLLQVSRGRVIGGLISRCSDLHEP